MQSVLYTLLATVPALVAAQAGSFIPVPGYSSLGCYTEPAGSRALDAQSTTDAVGMTVEMCATFCAAYQYFGVEYAQECYCGNTLAGGALDPIADNCNTACAGNAAENCGGHGAMNLYKADSFVPAPVGLPTIPTIPGYAFVDCHTDGVNWIRTLQDRATADEVGMTNEVCASYCSGFTYFGTENTFECYCGNQVNETSTPAPLQDCSMPCAGAKNEICGGYGRMNLYSMTAPAPVPTSTVESTTVATSTSEIQTTTVAEVSSEITLAPTSTEVETSTVEATTSAAISTASADPLGFQYVGCFVDHRTHKMNIITTAATMNPTICMSAAKALLTAQPPTTYNYIGVEAGSECYGATAPFANPTSRVGRKACTRTCAGQPPSKTPLKCGGRKQLGLYASVTGDAFPGPIATKTS